MTTIVLLPGMDGTGMMFAGLAACLEKDHKIILASYPGDQVLDYARLIQHARAFLPVNEPFILIAESFSGPIAISLAASGVPGLAGLVLCCTFVRMPRPLLAPLCGLIRFLPVRSQLIDLAAPFLFGRFSTAELRAALRNALAGVSGSVLQARMQAVLEGNVSAELKAVRVPILYIKAAQDRIVPESASEQMLAAAACIRIVTLPGPHLLLQAVPDSAAGLINAFARELPAS